ncbi:MAG: cupin domain-containing protein [Bdellovibrionales bacterium]
MPQYHFTRDRAKVFELFGQLKGYSYNSHEQFSRCCVSYLESKGHEHKLSTCHTSDLFYYIIDGAGEFMVGGERFQVKATDAVLVPRETEYGYIGDMKYVLFMTPSFTEGCETRTERSLRD